MSSGINENKVPISEKTVLTVQECSALTGIGQNTLEYALNEKDCPFALIIGRKKMIIRKAFDEYLLSNRELITPSPKKGDKDRFDLRVEDINGNYKVFPDRCAHSSTHAYSILGHVVLDSLDDKDVIEGNACSEFFDKMGVDKESQIFYSPYEIAYDKSSSCVNTLAEHIARDWTFTSFENKKPFGCYLVNDAPTHNVIVDEQKDSVSTQVMISPLIDCWSREYDAPHIIIPDKEGALLLQHGDMLAMRDYKVVVIDCIKGRGSYGFNPFKPAIDAAMKGDAVRVAVYVENITDIIFSIDKFTPSLDAEFYATANRNVFKLVAYSLIANALHEYREKKDSVTEEDLDKIWQSVTIHGIAQAVLQLSAYEFDWKEKYPTVAEDDIVTGEDFISMFGTLSAELCDDECFNRLILNARNAMLACLGPVKLFKAIVSNVLNTLSKYETPVVQQVVSCDYSKSFDVHEIINSRYGMHPTAVFFEYSACSEWLTTMLQMFVAQLEGDAFSLKMHTTDEEYRRLIGVRYVIPEAQLLCGMNMETYFSVSLGCDHTFTIVVNSFSTFKNYFNSMVQYNTMNVIFFRTRSDGTLRVISDLTSESESSTCNPRRLRTNDLMSLDKKEVVTISAYDGHALRCRNDNIMPFGKFMFIDNVSGQRDYHSYSDWVRSNEHIIDSEIVDLDYKDIMMSMFDSYVEKKHTD